ncbi:MAG: helix-turn-helix transcriptional regulator [Clostridia bacterium]|nr:helix-turn-helix transcriptional regulator [Clostridia bacterium]
MTLYSYRDADFYVHHTITPTPNPLEFASHMHSGCELYCFLSGEGSFHIEGSEYPLSPGLILLTRPGELHRLAISGALPYERVAVHFPADALDGIDADGRLRALFFDRPLGQGNVYAGGDDSRAFVTSCIYRLVRGGELSPRTQTLANLLPILCELSTLRAGEAISPPAAAGLAADVIAYVNAHLYETWTLDDLAAHFFFSRTHLSRVFRQATGLSVWDYTLLKRLIAAREQIRGGIPATEAAATCGFGDYSSFYRQYKRRFGVSPQEEKR